MFYSATTGGFYTSEIHQNIPLDAVEISNEKYLELLQLQEQGQAIAPSEEGQPINIAEEE